ncbi:MAG TPA: hypothetical protein VLZ28_01110 [Daejeonella sp.]|nr:hypothetical protein [Daejeonella sp.]
MKTLKTISTLFIAALSLSAYANAKPDTTRESEMGNITTLIRNPQMEWGNPADVNSASVLKLKNSPYLLFEAPAMIWGNPEELNMKAIDKLKNAPLVPAPAMVWGNPEDSNLFSLEQ